MPQIVYNRIESKSPSNQETDRTQYNAAFPCSIITYLDRNVKVFSEKMKICGIICEYNPFHNGHAYLIERVKAESGCDALLCVMSGNFTQRGDAAILEKHVRARHAILAGADAGIELPAAFAIPPAEIFARGGIRLLSSIPAFASLAFGCENGDAKTFLTAAKAMRDEDKAFRAALHERLRNGYSLTSARSTALESCGLAQEAALLRSPNNILGIEYCKALLAERPKTTILPVRRRGAGYADPTMHVQFSSATAIRSALKGGNIDPVRNNVPDFVLKDLQNTTDTHDFGTLAVYAILTLPIESLRKILDCSEGLENRLYTLAKKTPDYDAIVAEATSKRYIASRICRIMASAVLGIDETLIRESLCANLYLNILAVRKCRVQQILPVLAESPWPILLRNGDEKALSPAAKRCHAADSRAEDIYAAVTHSSPPYGKRTVFV